MTGPTSRTRREMVSTMRAAKGRPRRGIGVWRCLLELLPETPRIARPTYEAWYAMGHEITHALLLGMRPPFSSEAINRRLMALSRRTRIDHEIRVSAAQYQIASNVTGARALSPAARRWLAAVGGATSMMLELHYGGNILRAYDLQAAVDHNPLILAETKRITETMWKRAERVMRAHPPDRDVDRAMAVIEEAMRERGRKRKRTRPTGEGGDDE